MGRTFWRYPALFAIPTVASGGLFWAASEESFWWAHVDDAERGSWPKFKFHWPEQLVMSTVVGAFIAAVVTLVVFVVNGIRSRLTRRAG
jgi:hypothetical protein